MKKLSDILEKITISGLYRIERTYLHPDSAYPWEEDMDATKTLVHASRFKDVLIEEAFELNKKENPTRVFYNDEDFRRYESLWCKTSIEHPRMDSRSKSMEALIKKTYPEFDIDRFHNQRSYKRYECVYYEVIDDVVVLDYPRVSEEQKKAIEAGLHKMCMAEEEESKRMVECYLDRRVKDEM